MWIIEHSTTPHDVVTRFPTLGRNPKKIQYLSQPSSFPACHTKQPVSPSGPASVRNPLPGGRKNFLKPNAAYAPRQIQLGIELDFLEGRRKVRLTKNRLPACKTRSSSLAGIVSWLFALGSILSFIASSLTLSKQTAYQSCAASVAEPHLENNFHFPLDLFSEPCNN